MQLPKSCGFPIHKVLCIKTWNWYNCNKDLFPFTTINNFKLYSLFSDRFYCNSDSNESCLTLKPPKNLSHLFNEFNSLSSYINNTPRKCN